MPIAEIVAFIMTFNNPHLYTAYTHKLGLWPSEPDFIEYYWGYYDECRSQHTPFLKRKPDSTDEISHDEVLGVLYNLYNSYPGEAEELSMRILRAHGMVYSHPENEDDPARYVMKHFDVRGVVEYIALETVDPLTQALWAITIIKRALSDDPGYSHHLRTWIADEFASKVFLPSIAMQFYKLIMNQKGKTLESAMKAYFVPYPFMADAAKRSGF